MAKTIDVTLSIPLNAGAVRSQLRNADDLVRIAYASGAVDASATVDDNITTVIRTIDAPANARGFLKSDTIQVVERRTWTQNGADIELTVTGFPLGMTGHIDMKEHGENCVMHIVASVEARMGIASPLAEGMLKDRLHEAIKAECEALY